MSFDPYYVWLGIPPKDQPADHYRLLGIRRFEPNPDVIENAVERQLLTLKNLQRGPHGDLAKQLIRDISAARKCLLAPAKKSDYDRSLLERQQIQLPPVVPLPKALPPGSSSVKEFGRFRSGDKASSASAPPVQQVKKSEDTASRASVAGLSTNNRATLRWGIVGSVVSIGVCLGLVWWFASDSSPKATGQQARKSRPVNRDGKNVTRRAGLRVARANAPRTPAGESRPVQSTDTLDGKTDQSDLESKPDEPRANEEAPILQGPTMPVVEPAPPRPADNASDIANKQPRKVPRDGNARSSPVATENGPASQDEPKPGTPDLSGRSLVDSPSAKGVFSRLPSYVDLQAQLASPSTRSIVIGNLVANGESPWSVQLEDYASPAGQSRFQVGTVSIQEGVRRWPLERTVSPDQSPEPPDTATNHVAVTNRLNAYVEIGPTEFVLRFSDAADPKLVEQLSVCGLTVECGQDRHWLQLSPHRQIPPMTLNLASSGNAIAIDSSPAMASIDRGRITFEILEIEFGNVPVPVPTNCKARCDKELTFPLGAGLPCDLGVKLTLSGGQFRIVTIPWYKINSRRRRLVAIEIEKDLARAKSQYAKSLREFNEARAALNSLPRQIQRIRSSRPRNAQEAAMQQAQVASLDSVGSKMRSRARRLSKACPSMDAGIKKLTSVLDYAKKLPNQAMLHFRIYAGGDTGDFLMVRATSVKEPAKDNAVQTTPER